MDAEGKLTLAESIDEIDNKERLFDAEVRRAKMCLTVGRVAFITPLVAAAYQNTHSNFEYGNYGWMAAVDVVALMVGSLGGIMGFSRYQERQTEAGLISLEAKTLASEAKIDSPAWASRGAKVREEIIKNLTGIK